ncbi:hypothetical protein VNO77_42114 [Canavalia gladiata]|uniref:Uncharacterized protein n=1 Tax=Canavalia gladiata TaxID=3824 RepID=A0AAN9K253_CANGL
MKIPVRLRPSRTTSKSSLSMEIFLLMERELEEPVYKESKDNPLDLLREPLIKEQLRRYSGEVVKVPFSILQYTDDMILISESNSQRTIPFLYLDTPIGISLQRRSSKDKFGRYHGKNGILCGSQKIKAA